MDGQEGRDGRAPALPTQLSASSGMDAEAGSIKPELATAPESPEANDAVMSIARTQRTAQAHLVVLAGTIAAFSPLYALQALYPAITARFSGDVGLAASLLTATTIVLTFASLLSGRPAAAHGPRAALLWSLMATVVSTIGIALADGTTILVCWRLVQGVTISVGLSSLISSLSLLSPTGSASLAATYTTGVVCGGILGRFLPAWLMDWGWTQAFLAFACLQAALLVVVWCLFRVNDEQVEGEKLEPIEPWLKSLIPVLRNDIPHVAIGGCVLMISQAAATTYVSIRLAEEPFKWSTTELGLLYLVFLPSLVVVRLVPPLITRLGPNRLHILATNLLLAGLLITMSGSSGQIVVGMAIFCSAVFATQTVFAHLISSVEASKRQRASSGYLSAYYLGASLGAALPALIWKELGWTGTVAIVCFVQALGAVLAWGVTRRQPVLLAVSDREAGISTRHNAGDTHQH